jgi:hypothetical protein
MYDLLFFLGITSVGSFEAFSEGEVPFNDKFLSLFCKNSIVTRFWKLRHKSSSWNTSHCRQVTGYCWQSVCPNIIWTLLCELTCWKPIWVKIRWTNLRYKTALESSVILCFRDWYFHNASFWSSMSDTSILKWSIFWQWDFPCFYLTE